MLVVIYLLQIDLSLLQIDLSLLQIEIALLQIEIALFKNGLPGYLTWMQGVFVYFWVERLTFLVCSRKVQPIPMFQDLLYFVEFFGNCLTFVKLNPYTIYFFVQFLIQFSFCKKFTGWRFQHQFTKFGAILWKV